MAIVEVGVVVIVMFVLSVVTVSKLREVGCSKGRRQFACALSWVLGRLLRSSFDPRSVIRERGREEREDNN